MLSNLQFVQLHNKWSAWKIFFLFCNEALLVVVASQLEPSADEPIVRMTQPYNHPSKHTDWGSSDLLRVWMLEVMA